MTDVRIMKASEGGCVLKVLPSTAGATGERNGVNGGQDHVVGIHGPDLGKQEIKLLLTVGSLHGDVSLGNHRKASSYLETVSNRLLGLFRDATGEILAGRSEAERHVMVFLEEGKGSHRGEVRIVPGPFWFKYENSAQGLPFDRDDRMSSMGKSYVRACHHETEGAGCVN